ncbi:FkbM family methyltransferase [Micromonospora sp. Llam0]|uniref:FkbM family methyltransferase n=1 Tax=Micromonospora sp. Llam0 TaxID=2485143 RepID=UPI000F49BFD0|nr:FkbM family methyltransferase [Micromonospora sp. Llam0]
MPGNSIRYPEDKELQKAVVARTRPDWDVVEQYRPVNLTVPTGRLAEHLDLVGHVHLMKIDVEGTELNVLAGVDDRQWTRVDNIVLEVQDSADRLARTLAVLASHGFGCEINPAPLVYPEVRTYPVTARRSPARPAA